MYPRKSRSQIKKEYHRNRSHSPTKYLKASIIYLMLKKHPKGPKDPIIRYSGLG